MTDLPPDSRDQLVASLRGLHVQAVGRLIKKSGRFEVARPRTLNSFAAVYLDGGCGVFESEATGRIEVREGTAFILFPGVWHRYGPRRGENWQEYWAIFEGFIPERYRRMGLWDPARPVFALRANERIAADWKECVALAERGAADRAQRLADRVFEILGELIAGSDRGAWPRSAGQRTVEEIIALMESHLGEARFPLETYASRFFASHSSLRRRFREVAGMAPGKYFARMKMQVASVRLLTAAQPVKTIAASLGFDDPYHFSRRFKEIVGLSPLTFRKAFASVREGPGLPG